MTSHATEILQSLVDSTLLVLKKGDVLFYPKDNVRYMYVVKQGEVKMIRHTRNGDLAILQLAKTGDLLAEASLFSEKYHCMAVVESERVELLLFERIALLHALKMDSKSMLELLSLFSQQIRQQRTMLELHRIRSARQRIYTYFQLHVDKNHQITMSCSYKDLAYQLGLTHEALYRSLKILENEGKIQRIKNIVQVY